MRKMCCGGAIQALVTGTTVVNGTIEPILEVARGEAVFYGISIAGLPGCLVSSGFVRGRRDMGWLFHTCSCKI